MKKVVSGDELRVKMKDAINMLCDTVKTTLGPKGDNVIIDHSTLNPFITNDGVTIAENIESDDEVINTILELAKESTIKTNDVVGDGTTTTLVLMQSIYNEGLKLILEGISPIVIKNRLNNVVNDMISLISRESKKPTKEQLYNIACVSSNDTEIGKLVYNAFLKVKNRNFINIVEGNKSCINYIKGYIFETVLASSYFLEKSEIKYINPYVLLSDTIIYDTSSLYEVLNFIKEKDRGLVVIAEDYDDGFVNEILSLVINEGYNITLLKLPLFGKRRLNLLKDIECISSSKIGHDLYTAESLGIVNKIVIDKDFVNISFEYNDIVKTRIRELNTELKNEKDDYEKDFYKKRIAMLKNKTAEIVIGGITKSEIKEKMMRCEDALCAVSCVYDGILPGGGISLYKISNNFKDTLVFNALKEPMIQILKNSGLEYDSIIKKIVESNYSIIYNVNSGFEDINTTSIIDPTLVVKECILNAISTAGMLLSTTSLVINENREVNPKVNYDNL